MIDDLFITTQEQKARNKNKIGLPPKKRYRLTPLARHKTKNRSRYCHLFPLVIVGVKTGRSRVGGPELCV